MKRKEAQATAAYIFDANQPEPEKSIRGCQHTLYHSDRSEKMLGSWSAVMVGNQVRIECWECGKFYSYLVEDKDAKRTEDWHDLSP